MKKISLLILILFLLSFLSIFTVSHAQTSCTPDYDEDGLCGSNDNCPNQYGSVADKGCPDPDRDNDGIANGEDECPDRSGPALYGGCPAENDDDGDGMPNDQDSCPTAGGPAWNGGCPEGATEEVSNPEQESNPDDDGDGTPNNQDGCPTVAGPSVQSACPLPLPEDSCHIVAATARSVNVRSQASLTATIVGQISFDQSYPVLEITETSEGLWYRIDIGWVSGTVVRAGEDCSETTDSDGDSIPNDDDKCPDVASIAENSGCPADDSDSDGIPDSEDECPELVGIAATNGCPDSDEDGIPDSEDECTYLAGPATYSGCGEPVLPDRDGDGVPDNEDECPSETGLRENAGCPVVTEGDDDGDQRDNEDDVCPTEPGIAAYGGCDEGDLDGDGIPDSEDECPETAGLPEFGGCNEVDSDGDGIPNSDDKCRNLAGTINYSGCPAPTVPDRDGDGVTDTEDECPDETGLRENAGCPVVTEGDDDGDQRDNEDDVCPTEAGIAAYGGCDEGDLDGDGVPDTEDECPETAGTPEFGGCNESDSDGDGIPDSDDKCRNLAGTINYSGCPAPTVPDPDGAYESDQAPEINVLGNAMTIVDGDNTPSTTDFTDFGTTTIGTAISRSYTIENLGDVDLTGIVVTVPANFTLTLAPSGTIAGGASSTFTIQCDASSINTFSGTVSIANNDPDENPYTFGITCQVDGIPEIDVLGNSVSIADGDATPTTTDDTDFGTTTVGTTVSKTFTIDNTGSGDLTGITVSLPAGFSLTTAPVTTITAGNSDTFTVTCDAASANTFAGTVSIANNDSDENPYIFDITCQVNPNDQDNDGLADDQDACPEIAGPIENTGCPANDQDNDGVFDNADECPEIAGLPEFAGCPGDDEENGSTGTELPTLENPVSDVCVVSTLEPSPVNIYAEPDSAAIILGTIEVNEWVWVLGKLNNLDSANSGSLGTLTGEDFNNSVQEPNADDSQNWIFVLDSDGQVFGWSPANLLRFGGDCEEFATGLTSSDFLSFRRGGLGDISTRFQDFRFRLEMFPFITIFFKGNENQDEAAPLSFALDLSQLSNPDSVIPGNCSLVPSTSSSGSELDCGEENQPLTLCQGDECFELYIPDTCQIDLSNAGQINLSCLADATGMSFTPVGASNPVLVLNWDSNFIDLNFLPAVQHGN